MHTCKCITFLSWWILHYILFLKIQLFLNRMKPTWKSTFLRTTNLNVFFFFLEDALIGYWHKYDWFQTLLGQNSCLSDLVLFIFTRLSSRCPVIVCLYLWCGSETGLLLAAGWCRDAALGTRSCLRWVLLLTELCRWHAYCNPALGKPANSNSHSGLRQTEGSVLPHNSTCWPIQTLKWP